MSPAPRRGEWGTGDVGAATAAVPIDKINYGVLKIVLTERYAHRQLRNGASLKKRRKVPSVGKLKRRSFKIKFFTNLLWFSFLVIKAQNKNH